MKTKEIIALALFAVVLAVVVILLLNNTSSGQAKKQTVEIEVIAPINPEFSQEGRAILLNKDPEQPIEVFLPSIDVNQGLGNPAPFTADN